MLDLLLMLQDRHSGASSQQDPQAPGGREQESNLPRAAWQPQPGLKSGRSTGTASPPSVLIAHRLKRGKLVHEAGFLGGIKTAAIQPKTPLAHPSDHRPR